jgi:glucans biosynthesis protein
MFTIPSHLIPSSATCRRAAMAIVALLVGAHVGAAAAFGFEDVARRAADLSAKPYKAPAVALPKALQGLSYDQYRDIRFKPAKGVWRTANLPFELQLFHPGLYYDQPVRISEVVDGKAREIRFDPELFDYGKNKVDPQALRGLAFAGFRVHFPLNSPKYKDEVLVFQGASYFRALGKDQRYGLSARGLDEFSCRGTIVNRISIYLRRSFAATRDHAEHNNGCSQKKDKSHESLLCFPLNQCHKFP